MFESVEGAVSSRGNTLMKLGVWFDPTEASYPDRLYVV